MTNIIINLTTLALDNRLRYTAIGSNPYQSFLLYAIFCWIIKKNINM